MTAITARELLNRLEQQTEGHIQTAIHLWQNMDDAQLLAPPPHGGWSIAQCLDHLNGYGDHYFKVIRAAMARRNDVAELYKPTWLGNYFTKMLDPDSGKRKIKTFAKHNPPPSLDARAVVAEFIRQQEDLLTLLREARNKNLNAIKIPTTLSKWVRMNLGDTFRFVIAHNERHIRQAKRVMP
jgi:DinB superfamily